MRVVPGTDARVRREAEGRVTARQREVLAYIVERYVEGGPMPTGRELSERFYWNRGSRTAHDHLFALEEAGALRRKTGARSYGIIKTHPVVAEMLKVAA